MNCKACGREISENSPYCCWQIVAASGAMPPFKIRPSSAARCLKALKNKEKPAIHWLNSDKELIQTYYCQPTVSGVQRQQTLRRPPVSERNGRLIFFLLFIGRKIEKYVESTSVRQRKESVTISSSASIRYPTPSSLMM